MKTLVQNNFLTHNNVYKPFITQSLLRLRLLLFLLPLAMTTWAHNTHYNRANVALASGSTGSGTVYLVENGTQTTQSSQWDCGGSDSGTHSKNFDCTCTGWADGYYFAGWNQNPTTAGSYASTSATDSLSFGDQSSTESPGDKYYYAWILGVKPTSAAGDVSFNVDNLSTTLTKTVSFTQDGGDAQADFNNATITLKSGGGTWTHTSTTYNGSTKKVDVVFTYKSGRSTWSNADGTRTDKATLTLSSKGNESFSTEITASLPNVSISAGSGGSFTRSNATSTETGFVTFPVTYVDNKDDLNPPTIAKTSGEGTWTITGYSYSANTVTVNYSHAGDGTYGSRASAATITLSAKAGGATNTCNVTATYPAIAVTGGDDTGAYPLGTEDALGTATFFVSHADALTDFTIPTAVTDITGGTWTVNDGSAVYTQSTSDPTTGTVTIDYTYNAGDIIGEETATLTLTSTNGSSYALTLTGERAAAAEQDVSVTTAGGVTTNYDTWAAGLAAANAADGCTLKLLRDVSGLTASQEITKTMTLDLNHFTLSGTLSAAGGMLKLNTAGKVLTITDGKSNGGISVSGDVNGRISAVEILKGALVMNKGDLTATNANTGATKANIYVATVYLAASTNMAMKAGNITARRTGASGNYCHGIYCAGTGASASSVNLTDGTITSDFANGGYAIGVYAAGTSIIKDMTISGNAKTCAYAIWTEDGKLAVNGGTLSGTTSTSTARALYTKTYPATKNAVVVNNAILNATAETDAKGVYCQSTSATISGDPTDANIILSNVTVDAKTTGTTNAFAIFTDPGVCLLVNSGDYSATAQTTDAYAVQTSGYTAIVNGTFNATATDKIARAINVAAGITAVRNGSFNATATTEKAHTTYVASGAKLLTYGGTFHGKLLAATANQYATGSYIASGGTLEAQGGTFWGEIAKEGLGAAQTNYAIGVYAPAGSTISIQNATLKAQTDNTYVNGAYALNIATANAASLTNCTLQVTSAYQYGYGIFNNGTPMTVKNSTINVNTTYAYNYGIRNKVAASKTEVENSTITCISGTTYAYGAYVEDGTLTATNCVFSAETQRTGASSAGNCELYGINVNTGKSATLSGCTINATGSGAYSNNGYGVYVNGSADIEDCTVTVSNINSGAYAIGNTSNTTRISVGSGKFKATATSTGISSNGTAAAAKQQLYGGYYNTINNLEKYLPAGYAIETLPSTSTEYSEGYRYAVRLGSNLSPVCKIGSTPYYSLEEALEFVNKNSGTAYTILMTANYTLPAGDYTLPAKATLLVPYDGQTSAMGITIASSLRSNERITPSANLKLTFATGANLTAFGIIETGGREYDANGGTQTGGVNGKFGQIILNSGSHIDMENNSKLQCWGYITGDGTITAKNGSQVYEHFEFGVNKGGTIMSTLISNNKGVFAVDDYFYQNIEAEITYKPGSQAFASSGMYIRGNRPANEVKIVGSSNEHLFKMSTDEDRPNMWVRKKYNPTTDRCTWTLNDGAQFSSINITISGYGMNSSNFVLPIASSMDIVMNYGTLAISSTQKVMLIPGSRMIIKKDATLRIPSGTTFYVWDVDQWNLGHPVAQYVYSALYQPTRASNPRSGILTNKTSLPSGEIYIQGTLEVSGNIQTTTGGAYIHSTNEDAGQIVYNTNATATGKVYQYTTGGNYTESATTSAKLQNGDETYEATAGTTNGDKWIYRDDKWVKVSTSGCFVVETISGTSHYYAHPKDWVEVTANTPDDHAYHVTAEPTRYVIQGADCNWIEVVKDGDYYKCINENSIYNGSYFEWSESNGYWVEKKVSISFNNQGTVTTYNNIPYKTKPQYAGATPTKASTASEYYTWTGWTVGSTTGEFYAKDAELPVVTENTTFYAYFETHKYSYAVLFKNYDGSVLQGTSWEHGQVPYYSGEDPKKPATAGKIYTFTGWSPAFSAVTGTGTVYTAQFAESDRKYTVQWVNYNGTVLKEEKVAYGTTPTAPVEPTRPNDEFYTYTFDTWSPAITSVSGNQTYTATYNYEATVTKYTVTFKNGSETIYTQSLPNDETPAFGGTTPTKTPTAQYTYTFDGWSTSDGGAVAYAPAAALPDVSGADVTYYAHFSTTTNTYTIRWKSEDGKILYETDPTVSYGSTPSYDGVEPTKARLGETQYAHDGWSSSIGGDKNDPLPTVSGNTTYYAHFIEAYDITWVNEDGSVTLETDNAVPDGSATVYNGATPTKDATAQYTFTFNGWAIVPNGDKVYNNGATPTVSGLATYYVHFGSTIRSYDVTFNLKGHGDDIDSQVKDYGSFVDEPAAPEATGYTFAGWYKESSCTHEWTFASDVVTGATTLYAKWTPNTNTPYTVKHYKQKLDGTYQDSEPDSPFETENMTGTTDADVTPATKSYTGFTAPAAITAPVEADGTLVIGYYYTRNSHSLSWNWAGGSTSATVGDDYTAGGDVKYEAPLTYPANGTMTRTGYDFNGWSTSVTTMPAEELTITATWTPKKYAITWKSEDGSSTLYTDATADYDSEPVYGGATPTKAQDADYTYTFDGWTTEADGSGTFYEAGATPKVSGDATYYAHFAGQFRGTVIDIIDWTFEADKAATVTLNMNGYSSRKAPWHIGVSGTDIDKVSGDRNPDRSLTIDISSMNLTSGSTLTIICKDAEGATEHTYTFRVPYVYTSNTTLTTLPDGEDNTIFVHDGTTLTIDGTVEVSSVYVNPQAKLVITKRGHLTVLKRLVMRTTAWEAAELEDNGTLTIIEKMFYTRQISDKTSYYQFSLPYASRIEDVFSSNSKSTPYGNWILKRYDGASRAEHGEEGPEGQGNWVSLSSTDDIQPYTGYEIWSNSAYYRELFFPVTYAKHSIDDDIAVTVSPHDGTAAQKSVAHAGWNYISTPFSFTYIVDAPPTVTISELTEDNATYWQHVVDPSHPLPTARPFLYQAGEEGKLVFGKTITFVESDGPAAAPAAANGRIAESQPTSLQWIRLTAKAIETQLSDETNILISSRYTAAYELGCDVQKMLSNGNRPQVYTSLACGILTTTAVPDDITAIPLGLYTPEAGLYTITVDANRWQDRIDHVWLLDTESGTTHDLLFSPYQYAAEGKMTTSRFVLMPVMKAESPTESGNGSEMTTDVEDSGNTDIHVNVNGGQISVSGLTAGMPVMLYDAIGRLIAKHDVQQSREVSINVSAAGVYLLRYGNDTRRVVIGK